MYAIRSYYVKADYVAISFPRSAADIEEARALLREAGGHGAIVAKIERAEALDVLEEIVEAADAVMIARGDLGVEIGDAELPAVQKRIIQVARSHDRVVITATQMMQSIVITSYSIHYTKLYEAAYQGCRRGSCRRRQGSGLA